MLIAKPLTMRRLTYSFLYSEKKRVTAFLRWSLVILIFGLGFSRQVYAKRRCLPLLAKAVESPLKAAPKILSPIAGSTDNFPKSLPKKPENRILYGLEEEYGYQPRNPQFEEDALSSGPQDFLEFYAASEGQILDELSSLEEKVLYLRTPRAGEKDRWIFEYLPEKTYRQDGKESTHEIVSDVFPNFATYKKVARGIKKILGSGSSQGMMSVPRAAVVRMGQKELEGFVWLSSELVTLSSLRSPRPYHPFLHPYNSLLKGDYKGKELKSELRTFFDDRPLTALELEKYDNFRPKYLLGIVPRTDLAAKDSRERFFFEMRGCKGNSDCVEELMSQTTHVFQNEISGFDKYASLSTLIGKDPWKFGTLWENVGERRKATILRKLVAKMERFHEANLYARSDLSEKIAKNFLYPFKDWSLISKTMGFSERELLEITEAQRQYLKRLESALDEPTVSGMIGKLSSALEDFAGDSGLLSRFEDTWKRVTGKKWNLRF